MRTTLEGKANCTLTCVWEQIFKGPGEFEKGTENLNNPCYPKLIQKFQQNLDLMVERHLGPASDWLMTFWEVAGDLQ